MKYSPNDIIINNWAELRQTPDGKWNRLWSISLQKSILETIDYENISKLLSHEDFYVQVQISEPNCLLVSVTTERWGWDDELYFATYRMFEEIEHILGKIDKIQGENREKWSIWLGRKKNGDT
ncbi:hypothetical protein [uncultured Nostoc sp.]|uniref:hypothetical protein n=1 Tax=uncultured Nostoc sp. TaxID=340711 RepID=UPI0035CA240D